MSRITVITGERGAGKSRYCLELLEKHKKEGLSAGGFISPAVYTDGVKTAFYTMDVRTLEQRLCGTRTAPDRGTIGCWQMDLSILEWGNELLRNSTPCDVLFVDELGPLEFAKGKGYTEAFPVLKSGGYGRAYVVIRLGCLDAFRRILPEFDVIRIEGGACITGPRI
ncbi:MAG: hypothetical protein IJI07_06715 [Flexilinea sp.]|nr:hypothetical protein [Flexilinea sp.]